jgi:cysteine desulfuration protein SufE
MSDPFENVVAEFADLEPRERLEMLLEYANNLPPLPDRYEQQRLAGEHRIHECQSPVFLWVELSGETVSEKRVHIFAWVAPEAPTVKGFVGILVEALNNMPPETILAIPQDLLKRLGLVEALGMMRTRGLSAIVYYLRAQVQKLLV